MTSSNLANTNPVKSIFIIAGEESGDIHGAKLVQEILKLNPSIRFIGHGGDKMKIAGVKIIEHVSSLSVIGLTEVIRRLPHIRKVRKNTINQIKKYNPIRIILIDYPGFNLSLAKKIQKFKIPITYFILPQVWAWNENRAFKIKNFTDQALSIIPFEKDWFNKHGIDIDFVGHPFIDIEIPSANKDAFFSKHSLALNRPLLTLLPGSRQKERDGDGRRFHNVIIKLHDIFPSLQFIIGMAPGVNISALPKFVHIEKDYIRLVMAFGSAGIVASGTATLEAAVLGLPTVVCYKTSNITYWIGKLLIKVKYISLINLIAQRKVVPEFIQHKMTSESLVKAIVPLLSNTPERKKMIDGYKQITNTLGNHGVYSCAAKLIAEKTF